MSDHDRKRHLPTNPQVIGPGAWFTIHTMAMACDDVDSCLFFIQFVKAIIESFPCEKCKIHALEFVQRNPPEKYLHVTNNIDEHIGMFKWSWLFHNTANKGLNKPLISFEEAWRLYSEPSVCHGDCGKEEDDIVVNNSDRLPPPVRDRNTHDRSSYLVMKGSGDLNTRLQQVTSVNTNQFSTTQFASRR